MTSHGRAQQQQVASLCVVQHATAGHAPSLRAVCAQVDSATHLCGQPEAEVAEELREGGGRVEARQGLPHAVAAALAEGDEALRFAPVQGLCAPRVLRARLQQPSPPSTLCDGGHTAQDIKLT